MRIVRTRRGALQTAALTYRQPDSGATVTLVGMMHIGDAGYYRKVGDIIASQPQATVIYEGLKGTKELGTADETGLLRRLSESNHNRVLAKKLGLALQHWPAPEIQPEWINADMSALDFIHRMPNPDHWVGAMEKMGALPDDDRAFAALHWALRHLGPINRALFLADFLTPHGRARRKLMLVERNRIALEAIAQAGGDVVALWGAAHLPGLARGLRARGFVKGERRWLTAISAPAPLGGVA